MITNCLVRYKGILHATRATIKKVCGVGDAGITQMWMHHYIEPKSILGIVVYALHNPTDDDIKNKIKLVLDLDYDLKLLCDKKDEAVAVEKGIACFDIDGLSFAPLQFFSDPNKYRWARRVPHLQLFGKIFVLVQNQQS